MSKAARKAKEDDEASVGQEPGPRLVKRNPVEVDQPLPGMEDAVDQELLDAAGRYLASKADFQRASKIVIQDKDTLFEMMGDRQKEVYEHSGIRIVITKKVKRGLKVETFDDPTVAESEGSEEETGDSEG